MPWTQDQMAARAPGTGRRFLREPRHRHSHAGGQPHRRQGSVAAVRERHAGHRPVPDRGRGGRRPHQRRQADRDHHSRVVHLRQRPVVRHDPRRQDQPLDPGRHAGQREGRPGQLDDPGQDGQGHGRRHGPRGRRQARDRAHGTRGPEEGRDRGPEDPAGLHAAPDGRGRRRSHHHRPGRPGRDARGSEGRGTGAGRGLPMHCRRRPA